MDRWTVSRPQTLLEALQGHFASSSTNTLRKMLAASRVQVNSEVQHRAKHELQSGDVVMVSSKAESVSQTTVTSASSVDPRLTVLFEDEVLLVVAKPHHVLSVATDRMEADTLHSWCVDLIQERDNNGWAYIVHRLDRETSGVMVLAKSKQAKTHLQEQFAAREVHRMYVALVEGSPAPEQGTVRTWLMEDKHLNVKAVNRRHPQGKEAVSHYRTLSSDGTTSLMEVMIETGRRHQIRMAMQHLGTPIVGDRRHGADTDPHGRVMLHAHALEFLHPATDDPVRFEAPLPAAFKP